MVVLQTFFLGQRLIQQGVAGARAELLDDVLVEAFHGQQFADRDVGDFLDRAEAPGDQDGGDFLVHFQLVRPQSSRETKKLDRLLKKQEDPLKKRGMVGAVCRAIWIHDAIMLHTGGAYSRGTNKRYTYVDGSSSNGLIVYDDKYAYSEHATDPATKQLCNAFDLIRIHKSGHLDKNGDTGTKAQSYKAMCE